MNKITGVRPTLRSTTSLLALAPISIGIAAMIGATPALAQDASSPPETEVPAASLVVDNDEDLAATADPAATPVEEIVVTGSLFRRTNAETASPVTVLSSETLEQRGINTVSEAAQRLSSNGAGTIAQGWNSGSNFATGGTAVSLRGLSVQSTLTIFDGLRMAPYPLADDGHRNFVDLNTIPQGIVDRIEVLRDGASSTYGADAVAGVVNVITKDEIQGAHLNASAGISSRGDAGEQRIDATLGYGDLGAQGFNAYIAAEYQRSDALWARDRGYPFNSSDLSGICNSSGSCMPNYVVNGVSQSGEVYGLFGTTVPMVRPIDDNDDAVAPYRLLNTDAGCRDLPSVNLTPAQQAEVEAQGLVCQMDLRSMYAQLLPEQERIGFSGRFTADIGSRAQAYAMANYYQVDTGTQLSPQNFHGSTTPPTRVTFDPVYLPVYVCAGGVGSLDGNNGCNAQNGVLNPNNPFADQGQRAQLLFRYDRPRTVDSSARSLRGALGITGSFGNEWNYAADFTASNVQLDVVNENYLIPQRLMDVIADGSYNFVDPSQNSEEIRNYIAPTVKNRSTSDLWQATATISKDLFELPGGPLQAAVGVAYRHESIDNPSANPGDEDHPYDRYYGINAVGAVGSRDIRSAYFEVNAPVLDKLEFNVSGRYDDYSSGQSNFSPKIGAKFTPIPQLALRGTFSKGFRIPSFNEAYGLPTTGYITRELDPTNAAQAAFIAAHGGNAYATGPISIGLTATGNPSLAPEKSTSFTMGAIAEPIRNLSFTIDYWNIKVDGLIGGADYSDALNQYYANNGVVNIPGITVRPGTPDPQNPNALPHIGFIEYSFQNNNWQRVSGLDVGAHARFDLGAARWTSSLEASYLIKFERDFESGTQRYDGTLSPCDTTSCSGSPKLRATWQNTLEMGPATVTATAYYTSGYDLASIDYGGVKGDCEASVGGSVVTYEDGTPVLCKGEATWNVDLAAAYKVNDRFSIYGNILNVFDIDAPFDPSAAYGIYQYNPAWAGPNIMGRYFRFGVKVDI